MKKNRTPSRQWRDWRWQISNSIRSCEEAESSGHGLERRASEAEKLYPLLTTPYFLSLISRKGAGDSIARQIFPDGRELRRSPSLGCDPLAEEKQTPVPFLVHRYHDRAVLIATNRCPVHCRFCFRKRIWRRGLEESDLDDRSLKRVCSYLKKHREIREIIVSGGDPLLLETARLEEILDALHDSGIRVLRIGSRVPSALPMRVDEGLAIMLSKYPSLWMALHFNHPDEITEDSAKACTLLSARGIPLLAQTVLLAGVNDDAATLEELFRRLLEIKVRPYYLFHGDPVCGTSHFRTGVKRGLQIMKSLRTSLSSLGIPTYAIDLPEGGGKVHLQPDYRKGRSYSGINDKIIFYPD